MFTIQTALFRCLLTKMVLRRLHIFLSLLVVLGFSSTVFGQGNKLFITAFDENKRPVPKVEVLVDSFYAAITKPDGKLIISMKTTDDPKSLTAIKNGFDFKDWAYDTTSREITVNMQTTGLIKGVVTSKKGNLPVPNVEVLLVGTQAPPSLTNDKGEFKIQLPSGVSPNLPKKYAVYSFGLQSSDFEVYERDGISTIRLQQIPARRVVAVKLIEHRTGKPLVNKSLRADNKVSESNESGIVKLPYALTTKYEYYIEGYETVNLTYNKDNQYLVIRVQEALQDRETTVAIRTQTGDTILVSISSFRELAQRQRDSTRKIDEKIKELEEKLKTGEITEEERARLQRLINDSKQNKSRLDSIDDINKRIITSLTAQQKVIEQKNKLANQRAKAAQLEREKQQAENQRNTLIFASVAAILLLLAIAFFIFNRRNRKQNKLLGEKVTEINRKNEMLEESKNILDRKNAQLKNQRQELERQHTKITDSIRYALTIQESILPAQEKISEIFQDYFILYKPKDIVAGDFYWFAQKGDQSIISAIDCTGHGVPGGFMTMIGNTLLNQIVKEDNITDPKEILTQLNVKVKETLKEQVKDEGRDGDGMDLGILNFDMANSTATFCGAKTPLFYVKHGGKLAYIKGTNISIGSTLSRKKKEFASHTIHFEKGDMFYLASDGFQDQLGGPDNGKEKFLKKKFIALIEEVSVYPLEEQAQRFEEALNNWQGSGDQTDDIVILGLKV